MEQKSFNKITKEIFIEYGFTKTGSKYILELEDITIVVRFASWKGVHYFGYYFSINALHDANVPADKKYDTLIEHKINHTEEAQGHHQHEILLEQWSGEEYQELLKNMLHSYFDPYKNNGLDYLKSIAYRMCLTDKATMFLITPNDINEPLKNVMIDYYSDNSSYRQLQGKVISKKTTGALEIYIGNHCYSFLTDENGCRCFSFYTNESLLEHINENDMLIFYSAPKIFYNGLLPIVSVKKGDKLYLDFEKGKNDFIKWIKSRD